MSSSTTDRRLGLTGGTAFKAPCLAATTTNITLSGAQTIDSVAIVAGNRVLVKNQTTTTENGIYAADTAAWTRDLDADGNNDWTQGTLLFVVSGSANGAGLFEQTTAAPITVGSTSMAFTKIATLAASAVTQINVQNGQFVSCTVSGTNTILGTTVGTAPSALGTGQFIFFVPANTNTGATTFNRDTLGAVNIFYDGAALIGGELVQNIPAMIYHDGTQYQLLASAWQNTNYQTTGSVASAATLALDTAKPYSQLTGTTGVTAITLGNGRTRILEAAGAAQFTHSASLFLNNGGANVTTAAGDLIYCYGEAGSVVRVFFQRASGNTVSGTSLVPRSNLAGLTLSTAGSSATMSIAAGSATDSTNAQTMTLSSAYAKTTASWAVGTATGGLDTGAIANTTWYHFYAIMRTDTNVVDVLFSTSATAPTMPTNYSLKRRIGSGLTDGSAQWVLFIQNGDLFEWDVPVASVSTTNPGTSAILSTMKTPLGVIVQSWFHAFINNATTNSIGLLFTDPAETDTAPTFGIIESLATNLNGAAAVVSGDFYVLTNTSSQIRYRMTGSGAADVVKLTTKGWIDRRGRDS